MTGRPKCWEDFSPKRTCLDMPEGLRERIHFLAARDRIRFCDWVVKTLAFAVSEQYKEESLDAIPLFTACTDINIMRAVTKDRKRKLDKVFPRSED